MCKLDHSKIINKKYILCAYWNDDGIITDIKLEEMQEGYHYNTIKIAYRDETIKNLACAFCFYPFRRKLCKSTNKLSQCR
jgi:hypothetical protein